MPDSPSSASVPTPVEPFILDYAPAPESTAIVDIAERYSLFIGGE